MGARTINYVATQGIPFARIVVVKSKQRHRLMVPTDVKGQIQTGANTKKDITVSLLGGYGVFKTDSYWSVKPTIEASIFYNL